MVFFDNSHPNRYVAWYLIMVLIHISLIVGDSKHFFNAYIYFVYFLLFLEPQPEIQVLVFQLSSIFGYFRSKRNNIYKMENWVYLLFVRTGVIAILNFLPSP
jgi:hypothetical protein